jgi:2-alkyl-3-oxoalkanoate reductase
LPFLLRDRDDLLRPHVSFRKSAGRLLTVSRRAPKGIGIMRIFVSGATGVIGRRLIPALISAGHSVTAIGRSPEKREQLTHMGATPAATDLFAPEQVQTDVAGHDAVISLATRIPPGSRLFLRWAWKENDRLRSIASSNLCSAAIAGGATCFIQESFAPIYAERGDDWIDESCPVAPARYNRSVLDAERTAERFTASGRRSIVLRFAAFYGPDAAQVHDMIAMLRRGWAPNFGSPDAFFSSISHDDAASAVMAALAAPAGIYNVADDEPVRRTAYYGSLAEALGLPPPRFPPAFLAMLFGSLGRTLARSLRISNEKLRSATDWTPRYPSVREGWPAVVGKRERG